MTLFFKLKFKPFLDTWQVKKRGAVNAISVNPLLETFTRSFFPGLFESALSQENDQKHFLEYLKLLLFSHRHNKNDEFLKDTIKSFDLVRDTMYKYSK